MADKTTETKKSDDYTFHATNITFDQPEVGTGKNGAAFLTGTFEHGGKTHVFKAFNNGKLTPATDIFNKLSESREGYLKGSYKPDSQDKDKKYFHPAFAETVAERDAWIAKNKASKEAAAAPAAAAPEAGAKKPAAKKPANKGKGGDAR